MTDKCDYYESTALTADMTAHLEAGGRALFGVAGNGYGQPAFTVTLGNHAAGMPELLVVGTDDGDFLRDLSGVMEENGRPFRNGEQVMIAGHTSPFLIVEVGPDTRHRFLALARSHGHDNFEAMLVLPTSSVPDQRLH